VSQWYDVIIFTSSLQQYADCLIDKLDKKGIIKKRFFRQHCIHRKGAFIKDLTRIGCDLPQAVIIDDSQVTCTYNKENAIPIEPFFDNKKDEALLNMIPFLYALRCTNDVRSILGLR